jgi:hypothetical protein
LPPRSDSSAVTTILARASSMRSNRLLAEKAAEHHRMDGADAGAGLHRHHRLDAHRHVDDDAVALGDAERLQAVGELAHAGVQFLVADLGDRAVVGFEDKRGLVALGRQVAVDAVVGNVEHAVVEPLVERRLALVEDTAEGLVPADVLAREVGPETLVVGFGLAAQGAVGVHPRHVGLFDEGFRRGKYAGFGQDRFDGCHACLSTDRVMRSTPNSTACHAR